jgi:hypothetical protein
MFLGLLDLDPDPLARGVDLDSKNSKKNLDFYCFVTSFWPSWRGRIKGVEGLQPMC